MSKEFGLSRNSETRTRFMSSTVTMSMRNISLRGCVPIAVLNYISRISGLMRQIERVVWTNLL